MFNRLFSDFCGCCSLFQAGYNPPFPPMCALMMSISISINVLSINVLSINVGINTHHSINMAEHNKRSTTLDVKYIHGYTHVLGPFFTIEAQNGYHTIFKTQDTESNPAWICKGFLTHSNLVRILLEADNHLDTQYSRYSTRFLVPAKTLKYPWHFSKLSSWF